jgi:hypothetical protein
MEMSRNIRPKNAVSLILATFAIFLIVSCAIVYHGSLTKGTIVETFNSVVYLDIQSEHGASVGQELNVYKAIMYAKEDLAIPASKGVRTGKVRIAEIFDNHIAKAVVISGKAEKGDIVELVRPKQGSG